MLIINNEITPYNYLLSPFPTNNICKLAIDDEDDYGNKYRKTIRYMKNRCIIDETLNRKLRKESIYTKIVKDYIEERLVYGTNVIDLIGKNIAEYENCDASNIYKGIARLVELGIIIRARDYDKYKNDKSINKKTYIVNHNFIFKGNIKQLIYEFNEQR